MKDRETGAAPPSPPDNPGTIQGQSGDNPLDRPFDGPMATIPGVDVDVEAESIQRVWGIRPVKVEHASSEFERVVEYTDWRADARREGRFSQGYARTTHRISDRLDGFLGFPGFVGLLAAVDRSLELALIAAISWIGALLIWTPWTLWRVWAADPKGDVRRAGGFLAGAWALLVLPICSFNLMSLLVALALVYGLGLLLIYRALTVPPAGAPKAPSGD